MFSDYEVEDHAGGAVGGPLSTVASPNIRQVKTVLIEGVGWNDERVKTQPIGSGVMVDERTVLTAAHVVAGPSGYVDPYNVRVCTLGNRYSGGECQPIESLTAPGGVSDGTTGNDYAVIRLQAPWSRSVGWMAMSAASDSVLESTTHYHDGYAIWSSACTLNWTNASADLAQSGWYIGFNRTHTSFERHAYFGVWLSTAHGQVKAVQPEEINFNISSGSGMSGGPYYYCPAGCTDTAGAHFATAITSSHNLGGPEDMATNGAKVSSFRSWVIANM